MTKSEEKIKEFLGNQEKIKALASDEEFIGEVSGGTATPETYSNEFKNLGLELSDEESEETYKTTTKILNMPVEKLADISLENVAGGMQSPYEPDKEKLSGIYDTTSEFKKVQADSAVYPAPSGSIAAVAVGAVGMLGCGVAAVVCGVKSKQAKRNGELSKSATYQKAAIGLGACVAPFALLGGGGVLGIGKHYAK